MAKLEELQPGAPIEVEIPPESPPSNGAHAGPAAAEPDLRYFILTEPIETGGRIKIKLEKLLVDSTQLKGNDYFELLDRYVMEVPRELRSKYENEWDDKRFLRLLIIKLNPPMIESDFQEIEMGDLMPLFLQARGSIFLRRYRKMVEPKTQSSS